jgi:hypothetical protein
MLLPVVGNTLDCAQSETIESKTIPENEASFSFCVEFVLFAFEGTLQSGSFVFARVLVRTLGLQSSVFLLK